MATLFSIECTTCHRRLQVRKKSAIGQIVNCPACGSMVQLSPPPGWVEPSEPEAAGAKSAGAESSVEVASKSKGAASTAAGAAGKTSAPSSAGAAGPQRLPTPEELMAARGDRPEFPWDKVILAGAVLTAIVTLGVGVWIVTSSSKPKPNLVSADATGEASPLPTGPVSTAAAPAATGAESTTAATSQATGESSAATPAPATTSESTSNATPAGTSATASPAGTPAAATPEATAAANPPAANPASPAPLENPAPAPMEAPRAPLPAASDADVPARMADPVKKVEFTDLPLSQAVDFVAQLSGLSITLDVDDIAQAGATPVDPVSAKLKETTVGDLLDTILAQRGLAYVVEAGRLRVTAKSAQADEIRTVEFDVQDLDSGDAAQTERLAAMIRALVTPEVWQHDQSVKMTTQPGRLTLQHHASGCQAASEFLDKLRLARGMRLVPSPVLAPRTSLETRLSRVREKLMRKMLGNFKDESLAKILRYIERQAEVNFLIDNLALARIGVTPEEKTTLPGVKDEPIWMALERLLVPLGLAYRAVDSQTVQITSKNALVEQHDLEAYKIADLVPEKLSLDDFLAKLQSLVEPGSWGEFSPGQAVFDEQSGTLFVRQHQIAHGQIEDWLMTLRAPVKKGEPEKNSVEPPRAADAKGQ